MYIYICTKGLKLNTTWVSYLIYNSIATRSYSVNTQHNCTALATTWQK